MYYKDAKNEFNNMNLLVHEKILQVFVLHTIYISGHKKYRFKKKQKEESQEDGPQVTLLAAVLI